MSKEKLASIKHLFFTYRNGQLADMLRVRGDGHKVIFGLNLPQLVDIANNNGVDKELAESLWDNSTTRESRMLAPMVYPQDEFTYETACEWIEGVENEEVSDILCHKLLRYVPFSEQIAIEYSSNENSLVRYAAFRLILNLSILNKLTDIDTIKDIVLKEMSYGSNMTKSICRDIIEDFL